MANHGILRVNDDVGRASIPSQRRHHGVTLALQRTLVTALKAPGLTASQALFEMTYL